MLTAKLRTLGHPNVVIVDGGLPALLQGGPVTIKPAASGTFVVQRSNRWEIKREESKANLGEADVVIIDAREVREYKGKMPYGESCGDHVARHQARFLQGVTGQERQPVAAYRD